MELIISKTPGQSAAEAAFWCHVCMRTVPASQASTHQHDPGANGPR